MAEPKSAQHARLGRALRAIRTERGMTIEETAGRAGLNPRYLAGVERGEINIAVTNLLKTIAALELRGPPQTTRASSAAATPGDRL